MTRPLPRAETLRDAVKAVIDSNMEDGYTPHRFVQITQAGEASDLQAVCERLMTDPNTIEPMMEALRRHPTLLFLEDLVAAHGYEFPDDVLLEARTRAEAFDELAGGRRWQSR